MANEQRAANGQKGSEQSKPRKASSGGNGNGNGGGKPDEPSSYERELSEYLLKRIKPNLNSGAIPLLARSIAKEIANGDHPEGVPGSGGGQSGGEAEPKGEAESKNGDGSGEDQAEAPDFEADMREFQGELGEDWILRFSVHGEDAWLTADKIDGSQHLEAPTAEALADAIDVLEKAASD